MTEKISFVDYVINLLENGKIGVEYEHYTAFYGEGLLQSPNYYKAKNIDRFNLYAYWDFGKCASLERAGIPLKLTKSDKSRLYDVYRETLKKNKNEIKLKDKLDKKLLSEKSDGLYWYQK